MRKTWKSYVPNKITFQGRVDVLTAKVLCWDMDNDYYKWVPFWNTLNQNKVEPSGFGFSLLSKEWICIWHFCFITASDTKDILSAVGLFIPHQPSLCRWKERQQAIGTINNGEVWLIIVSKYCNSGYHTHSFEGMMHWQCHPAPEKLTFSPLSPLGPGSPYTNKQTKN